MSRFGELSLVHKRELAEFEPIYFQTREVLRSSDRAAWLRLHRLYPEFSGAWTQLDVCADVHVVTTRDQSSLRLLLDEFSIDIPSGRHWTKERTKAKPDAVLTIARQSNLNPSAICYVDDHMDHLRDVSDTGAAVYWASWGYWPAALSPRDFRYATLSHLVDLPLLKEAVSCA
jgi:phosphoglycolate phosphatase-like HAD superfamily hydrolase